jgi:hypothetical protein
MDCEKFDLHVIDALYDELDELTHAALRRHMEGCSRCASIYAGLRATREVGVLPIVEPADDLEDRILDAVNAAQRKAPWPRKLLRGLAWAGSHAMRPQLAMAALFFLVIGSSLLLLRQKPGMQSSPVRVTERGAPAPEAAEPPPPAATAAAAAPREQAAQSRAFATPPDVQAPRSVADKGDDAERGDGKARGKAGGKSNDAASMLADARAARDKSGCRAAVGKYDEVGARHPATGAAADAMWEAANCYKSMGEQAKARELYQVLRSNGGYRDRAEQELAQDMANMANPSQVAARPGGGARAAPAAPAPAAPPAAQAAPPAQAQATAAPAASSTGPNPSMGSSGKANAAPKRKAADHAY